MEERSELDLLEESIEIILSRHISEVPEELLTELVLFVHREQYENYSAGYIDADNRHRRAGAS